MKKFLAILLVVVLTAGISVGATLAYLTDTDAQVNTFTNGNVYIDLWEDFGDNDDAGIEKLLPAVTTDDGSIRNAVEKEVYVTNTGSEDAYVRVHIAIPTLLVSPDELLHVVRTPGTYAAPYWVWADATAAIVIDEVDYTVYTLTYGSKLAPDEVTVDAIAQVYLDGTVNNDKINELNTALGNEWKVYVCAQAAQTEGFDSAEQALDAAFQGNVKWDAVTGGSVKVKYTESDDVASVPTIITGELTTTGNGYGRQTVVGTVDKFENVTLTTEGGGISVWGTAVWNGGSITTNSLSTSPRHVFYVASGKDENGNVIADGHLTINGGEFTFSPGNLTRKGSYLCAEGAGATIIVNGGTFNKPSTRTAPIQALKGATVIIYGGTFCFDPSAYVADGYEAVESGGWWTVSAK